METLCRLFRGLDKAADILGKDDYVEIKSRLSEGSMRKDMMGRMHLLAVREKIGIANNGNKTY